MNWHERYALQAGWTRQLRSYLFERCGLSRARRVLEAGCGTGAILADLHAAGPAANGIDISAGSLAECRARLPAAQLARADVNYLPYRRASFDITFCHYFLLWLPEPLRALEEMKRVTVPSGYVIAFAEPDYGARRDRPAELAWLGQRQNEALQRQGAALRRGADLADLFRMADINIVEAGLIRPPELHAPTDEEWESEWTVLQADLAQAISAEDLQRVKAVDRQARLLGVHLLHVPTYFAWGQV